MLKLPFVLLFTAMTFVSWGVYGILLHEGQLRMGNNSLRSFVGVGIAYFLIAVIGAGAILGGSKEKGHWSFLGAVLSLLAGSVGALGALGVILALTCGGDPIYVMPLVFGGAPVINTLVTTWLTKTFDQIKPLFVIGMIFVGVGMLGVLTSKPGKGPVASTPAVVAISSETSTAEIAKAETKLTSHSVEEVKTRPFNLLGLVGSILMAIVCWGSYGPFLHLGQMRMGGSRLRPFLCVGLAYFAIAVALPIMILSTQDDGGGYTFAGLAWSIAAGTAGAVGALGIILAFNYGGKPIFVMPLIFGFAPVINTLVTMGLAGKLDQINPVFAGALGLVILGAVIVLITAPKPKHLPPPIVIPPPPLKPEAAPEAPAAIVETSEATAVTNGSPVEPIKDVPVTPIV